MHLKLVVDVKGLCPVKILRPRINRRSSSICSSVKTLSVKNLKKLRVKHESASLRNRARNASARVNGVMKIRRKVVQTAVAHRVTINRVLGKTNKQNRSVGSIQLIVSVELNLHSRASMVVSVRIQVGSGCAENGITVIQIVNGVKERSAVRRIGNVQRNEPISQPDDLRTFLVHSPNLAVKLSSSRRSNATTHDATAGAAYCTTGCCIPAVGHCGLLNAKQKNDSFRIRADQADPSSNTNRRVRRAGLRPAGCSRWNVAPPPGLRPGGVSMAPAGPYSTKIIQSFHSR